MTKRMMTDAGHVIVATSWRCGRLAIPTQFDPPGRLECAERKIIISVIMEFRVPLESAWPLYLVTSVIICS